MAVAIHSRQFKSLSNSIKSRHACITLTHSLTHTLTLTPLPTEPLFKPLGHYLLLTLGSCASGFNPLSMTKMLLIFCDDNIIILRIISIILILSTRHIIVVIIILIKQIGHTNLTRKCVRCFRHLYKNMQSYVYIYFNKYKYKYKYTCTCTRRPPLSALE
jgi:hypothetical protein